MNSDWADLEHVLFKIFPGAQVANTTDSNNFLQISLILPLCLQVLESFSDRRTYSVEQVLTCVPFSSITFHSVEQEAVQSLASAFQQLEKCKSQFNIEDYSLSQTTLEQVVRSANRKKSSKTLDLANIIPDLFVC